MQLCVQSPALAPLAEVPFALAAAVGEAPPGAAELVRDAIALGADANHLGPLKARLGEATQDSAAATLLLPRADAEAEERERRAALADLGVDVDQWAPADVEAPECTPAHHRMRTARQIRGPKAKARVAKTETVPAAETVAETPSSPTEPTPTAPAACRGPPVPEEPVRLDDSPPPAAPRTKRRRQINWDGKLEEKEQQADEQDTVQLPIQEIAAPLHGASRRRNRK